MCEQMAPREVFVEIADLEDEAKRPEKRKEARYSNRQGVGCDEPRREKQTQSARSDNYQDDEQGMNDENLADDEIGRASCRERGEKRVVAGRVEEKEVT